MTRDLPDGDREDVVQPIEETEEYAAAAEDDVPLDALAAEGGAPRLSGRPATAQPPKGPEDEQET
jgi:hypothetical protein